MGPGHWTAGLLASLVFHASLAALAAVVIVTNEVPDLPSTDASFDIAALNVPKDKAPARETVGDKVPEAAAQGQRAGGAQIPLSNAVPSDPVSETTAALATSGASVEASPVLGNEAREAAPPRRRLSAGQSKVDLLGEARPSAIKAPSLATDPLRARTFPLDDSTARSEPVAVASTRLSKSALQSPVSAPTVVAQSVPVARTDLKFQPAALINETVEQISSIPAAASPSPVLAVPKGETPKAAAATGAQLFATLPDAEAALETDPEQTTANVLLAWTGDLSTSIRQSTLTSAAALRIDDPGTDEAGLRDRLAQDLASVECGRAQTEYDPDTGTIDLRGHVKSDSDRNVLIAALKQGLQGALPIRDRLRRLPAPQCEVLTTLSDMGLPQSVEQFTNPLVIGDDLHARVYSFSSGDRIRFELQGAEYPGWLHLDYFDSEGRVLHLIPNPTITPLWLPAEAPLVFGGGGANDIAREKLELRVSPPFGEDIVVAMVVSEELFQEPRPMVENAARYLAAVEARISELRERSEDFRGEWVYLFVETAP